MPDQGLDIVVFSAFEQGASELAAFDRALAVGGAADVNLIALSSIVPPRATVRRGVVEGVAFGDRLYCVIARHGAGWAGEEAWAGIAWALDREGRGGVFAEAHGSDEDSVRADLTDTVQEMLALRPALDFGAVETEVVGGVCEGSPVCALVLAAVKAEPW